MGRLGMRTVEGQCGTWSRKLPVVGRDGQEVLIWRRGGFFGEGKADRFQLEEVTSANQSGVVDKLDCVAGDFARAKERVMPVVAETGEIVGFLPQAHLGRRAIQRKRQGRAGEQQAKAGGCADGIDICADAAAGGRALFCRETRRGGRLPHARTLD